MYLQINKTQKHSIEQRRLSYRTCFRNVPFGLGACLSMQETNNFQHSHERYISHLYVETI